MGLYPWGPPWLTLEELPGQSPSYGRPLSLWRRGPWGSCRLGSIKSSWRLGDIRGHSLSCVCFLFSNLRLLNLFGRTARREKGLGQAILANIYLFEDSVNLGSRRAWCTDGRRIVYTLYFPKGRRGLNPSLVKGLVPHLEVVAPTHSETLALRASLVSATLTLYLSCLSWSLAFSASSSFFFSTFMWSLVVASSSSVC